MVRIAINSAAFAKRVQAALVPAMEAASRTMVAHVKIKIGVSGWRGGRADAFAHAAGLSRAARAASRRAKGAYYVPSEPGQPPHRDTGRLQNSIDAVVFRDGAGVTARIGSSVFYARDLELGTARVKPRPFLRPSLMERGSLFGQRAVAELGRRLKR